MSKLRYFSNRDNFGKIENMDNIFLKILDIARHVIRQKCIVHCGYDKDPQQSIHTKGSRHYLCPCDAVDIHYIDKIAGYKVEADELQLLHKNLDRLALKQVPRTILEVMIIQKLSGLKRIGIYPFGVPRTYFHVDNYSESKTDFWIGLKTLKTLKDIKSQYPELSNEFDKLLNKIDKDKTIYIYPK